MTIVAGPVSILVLSLLAVIVLGRRLWVRRSMDETTAVQLRTIGYCLIGMAGGNVVHPLVMWWLDWSFWPALGVAAGAVALACVAVNAAWLGLRRLFARVMPARAERRRMDEARSRVIEQGKEVAVRSNVVRLRD